MRPLKFAVIGAGFWAGYQIPAWYELEGAELTAVCDRTQSKAQALADRHRIPRVYSDAAALLEAEQLDFVDIITDADSHAPLAAAAAKRGVAVVCQKPMAPRLDAAREMLAACEAAGVSLSVHENWRWQTPIRRVKALLDSGTIGQPFKARVSFCSAFPVFDNQPFLAELEEFILTDIGSHILDVCRFLFGEAESLLCHTASVNPRIRGEDVAQVLMKMKTGMTCFADMSYASILPEEAFPQTLILIEGSEGSIRLGLNHLIEVATRAGTTRETADPPAYPWADPAYALVHSSIVDCNRNLLRALQGHGPADTSGRDNLETLRLVHAAYASAREGRMILMDYF
ncbi:MAG: Gfo/Idh/MocA family oxidoreductase [Bacteroidia bacterium]|nr:Gfo/Idh/MocA family oxidoreductase [Bacteroidia bacterium]